MTPRPLTQEERRLIAAALRQFAAWHTTQHGATTAATAITLAEDFEAARV